MGLRSAYNFTAWHRRYTPLVPIASSRLRTATCIALGASASIYLATRIFKLETIHADSSTDDRVPPAIKESVVLPPVAGPFRQFFPLVYVGQDKPQGITRMFFYTRPGLEHTCVRVLSEGSLTLLNLLDGDLLRRVAMGEVVGIDLWSHFERLFSLHRDQNDESAPTPVDLGAESRPSSHSIHDVFKAVIRSMDENGIHNCIRHAFSAPSKQESISHILEGTGSCCLISALYEADAGLLHVANLGPMRGILGRPRQSTKGLITYDVHILSADHTPDNPVERSRIEKEHPGEEVIKDGLLLGRPYTRAIGEGKLKWTTQVQSRLHKEYLRAPPDPLVKTPPYISAEPDVSTIKVFPGDFLVLSTQWLSECLTDQEVVGLVGIWLEKNRGNMANWDSPRPAADVPAAATPTPIAPNSLPVQLKTDTTTMYSRWNTLKRFVNEDSDAAHHLANNAMGGADPDLRQALLNLHPQDSDGNSKSLGVIVVIF
ncbi:phosphatase 2C-domain-containing protein [Mycena rebaudengoi]|nr:phosphatase 2C-domain-containing protein [Mycena rebaudengoi]